MTARERYELLGPLATGGMAEVLLAKSSGPNGFERLLAVKRILPERAKDPEYVRMFLDEARNAAMLAHRNVVQVFDIELHDGVVLYAMEYLHGQTLAAVMARVQRLPPAAAIAIAIAVAAGLHHAHERPTPLVHRDVAPSNVMLTYDGGIKLIDFGIAKAPNNLSNTAFGTFKGRLGYSSPEQCRCEQVDRRTDVYSLGVMLYELTTGRQAIAGGTEEEMVDRMTRAQIAPPRSLDPEYPAELETIVMSAVSADRERRFATAAELQHALEAFAQRARLHISDHALSRMMHELFAGELAPWEHAKQSGMTLEEHVIRETLQGGPPTFETWSRSRHGTLPQPEPQPLRRMRKRRKVTPAQWAMRGAAVVVLFAASYGLARLLTP